MRSFVKIKPSQNGIIIHLLDQSCPCRKFLMRQMSFNLSVSVTDTLHTVKMLRRSLARNIDCCDTTEKFTGFENKKFQCKIVNIFLPINFSICFGCSLRLFF